MSVTTATALSGAPQTKIFPVLLYINGAEQREITLSLANFTIGRKAGKDLEIADPRVSRDHAEIVAEDSSYFVVDCGSKLGTFVNGQRVQRQKLARNDRIEFGVGVGAQLIFDPVSAEQSIAAREFLSQISVMGAQEKQTDLEKLALFLEAARKLNTAGALDEILLSLINTTLKLTGAERGFIYLRQPDDSLTLSAACTAKGERLLNDDTISHSILQDAVKSDHEFVVTDTTKLSAMAERESIIAHDLRTVIAIPLRKAHGGTEAESQNKVLGVLYLDARFVASNISRVSHDILRVIAREAAALVESTHLAQVEEASRRYQQELGIAAMIQQRLMTVTIPEIPFARIHAKNLPCRDIGGDFFDVISTEDGLTVVLTDVSGKGISAALLASILQGLIYAQVSARVPLSEIANAANRFLCQKVLGEKYATTIILRICANGEVEYVNCGHVEPILVSKGEVKRISGGNPPVGLLLDIDYEPTRVRLTDGDRIVLVTDGVTEAENSVGEFYGDERLVNAAGEHPHSSFDHILQSVRNFCGETPLSDDCTLMELTYFHGHEKTDTHVC